jgi:hypothetical protein
MDFRKDIVDAHVGGKIPKQRNGPAALEGGYSLKAIAIRALPEWLFAENQMHSCDMFKPEVVPKDVGRTQF